MKIEILCVGKIKEKFYREAMDEYRKRLSRYCELKITEVSDEPTPDNASPALESQIKDREGERILKHMEGGSYNIALCIDGKSYDSVGLSRHLDKLMVEGNGSIRFVIGGSLGLCDEVIKRCSEKISFSELTFPHQLMRVILIEQIYRSFRISRGQPYHK